MPQQAGFHKTWGQVLPYDITGAYVVIYLSTIDYTSMVVLIGLCNGLED